MIKKKILRTEDEFKVYEINFRKSLGANAEKTQKIPLDYFGRSHVIGYFNKNEEMIAGYILCKEPSLRLPSFVPDIDKLPLPKGFEFKKCQEIVCLWKEKSVSKHMTHKTLWPDIMTDFINSGQSFLLGHTQSEKLYKHYDLMSANVLYEGPSVFNLPSRLFFYSKFQAHALRISSYILSFYYLFKK